jgi:5-methyltetrahydropteroyltriglutamate--homocysteine methyltransferase
MSSPSTASPSLQGIAGTTAVHLCFGYGHYVKVDKPNTYSFLAPLNACVAHQISIEAAQPNLDPNTLNMLPDKVVMYGVLDLRDHRVETPEIVAQRIRDALRHVAPERLVIAPDCGMKYLPRAVAFAKLEAMVEGRNIARAELKA